MRCSRPSLRRQARRRLIEAMRYAALGGGKRLRPFLLIESARLFGVAEEGALDAARRARMRALLFAGA